MRGVAEPRNLALAISRRARRNFSAGIGRGRGGGSGKYDDAEEPLFGSNFGHGAPKGGPLNPGFLGRGGHPNSASGSPGVPYGGSSAGRGFNNLNQQTETRSLNDAPLFSNFSFGRGSVNRNQGEDPFSDAKPPQRPALNLGSGSFGRGKPVENIGALPEEDIFSSDHKALSSWSRWDQKSITVDTKGAPSATERRLLQDERSSSVSPLPAIPQQQLGQRGQERQKKTLNPQASASTFEAASPQQRPPSPSALQSSGAASPFQAAPPHQQPQSPSAFQSSGSASPFQAAPPQQRPSSPLGRQPLQQSNLVDQVPASYTRPPAGWQQPAQQPYQDIRFQPWPSTQIAPPPTGWQQPVQQPYYDARVQPQPFMQYTPPPTGWQQPVQQPYYDARVQPQFSMQYTPPPTGWQEQTVQQPNMYYTAPPTASQSPASTSHSQATNLQQRPPPGPPGRQPIQDFSGKSGESHGAFRADDWRPSSSGDSMHLPQQPFDPVHPFAESHQVPFYGGEYVETPLVAPTSSVGVSGNNSTLGRIGLDYEGKIDELYKQNKLDEIDDTYSKMKAAQIRASAKTYGTILQSYLQLGKMDKVSMIYNEMSGVLFAGDKSKDDVGKGTSTASRVESPTPHQIGGGASSTETHGAGKGTQVETKHKEDGELTVSRSTDTPSSGTGAQRFASFGQPGPSVGRGMGRGMNVERHGVELSVGIRRSVAPSLRETPGQFEPKYEEAGEPTFSMGMNMERHGVESSVGIRRSVAPSPRETPSSSQGGQFEPKYEEAGESTLAKYMDIPSTSSDTGAKSFTLFGQADSSVGRGMGRGMKMETHGSEPSVGTVRGRGKKVESFFNFDFSGGLDSADQGAAIGKQSVQLDKESKMGVQDEYSETFIPVIQPKWYAFAPEGLSVGPGAGRGRPQSPQARGVGLGSSPSQQFQQAPPLYSLDSGSVPAGPQYADPEEEEPFELPLSAEEAEAAAERAMKILTEKRVNKFKNMFQFDDQVVKRSPLGLARSLRERKQPEMSEKVEQTVQLTEEEQKKDAERLKVIEENEALQDLHYTFDQFMKFYGEMAVEPEHELGDFTNPDIEEKPFMPLEEYLEKAKPNIMKTGLIRNEKEWQDMVKDTVRHIPYYEEFAERYGGPGRYTAKQENEDLEEIAGTLPSDVGRAAKSFVNRSLTSLKSNPGLNLHQKQWMLASMVDEFSQYIVND